MLEAIAALLCVSWLAGVGFSYTMGGLIHLLLIAAIVVALVRDQRVFVASGAPEGNGLTASNVVGGVLVATSMLSFVYGGVDVPVWAAVGAMLLGGVLLLAPKSGWTSPVALREAPPGIFLHSRRNSAPREAE
jgi:hypothetical protein